MDYREKKVHGDRDLPVEIVRLSPDHFRYRMNLHWHPENEILYVQSGSICVTLNETVYALRAGDVLFIQSGTLHSAKPEDCRYACILVNLPRLMSENDVCMSFARQMQEEKLRVEPLLGDGVSTYASICEKLLLADPANTDSYPFLLKSGIFAFFGQILLERRYQYSESERKAVQNLSGKMKAAMSYIEQNYPASLRLCDIARQTGMSAGHFSRCFKSVTGQTPFEYVTRYRLSKAQYALASTDMSVTEIALDCGFNNVSYFISTFRQTYGTSPGQFRKNLA